MNNYGTGSIVIAGNSIEELEQELAKVKSLMAMGYTYGVGGKSIGEVEKGMSMVDEVIDDEEEDNDECCCGCCCNCYEEDDDDEWEEEDDDLYEKEEEDEVEEIISEIHWCLEDLKKILKG